MKKNWKNYVAVSITALFGFVVFSPETFSKVPWLIALSKFAMAGGLAALGIQSRNQSVKNAEAIEAVDHKVTETHLAINGRMDELIRTSESQGRQNQRDEDAGKSER